MSLQAIEAAVVNSGLSDDFKRWKQILGLKTSSFGYYEKVAGFAAVASGWSKILDSTPERAQYLHPMAAGMRGSHSLSVKSCEEIGKYLSCEGADALETAIANRVRESWPDLAGALDEFEEKEKKARQARKALQVQSSLAYQLRVLEDQLKAGSADESETKAHNYGTW